MKSIYKAGSIKSGPTVVRAIRTEGQEGYTAIRRKLVEENGRSRVVIEKEQVTDSRAVVFGVDHNSKWKRCSKKTAADLLEKDDDRPGTLTAVQREELTRIAGKQYRKKDPFLKRENENTQEYIRRINSLVG